MIDFEKAFDSVSWKFIHKVLSYFNFGPSISNWVKTLQNKSVSCVTQVGILSNFFNLERGCRQGDPIPPYNFFPMCRKIVNKYKTKQRY